MKSSRFWLTSLAVFAFADLISLYPVAAYERNPATGSDFSSRPESIEIYVPPVKDVVAPSCPDALEVAINRIIASRPSNWGIRVESLTDGTVLYSHNADKHFIPASNTKLFTTAAALQKLNPNSSIRSKSVKDWVTTTNRMSNNYYADALLRHIGGQQAAKSALANLGVDPRAYRLADGSGLSRRNAATPNVLVDILRAMYYAPGNRVFQASLPVAGVSGTLRNRMKRTPVQGTVYAKTGTLRGVRALSGYMNHPQHGVLLFSILANDSRQSGTSLVRTIDKIVLQINSSALNCPI